MKTRILRYTALAVWSTATVACDGFLDTMPDNRTELNNAEKVSQLLVSAYPTGTYVQFAELMTDNVTDNGPLYNAYNRSVEEAYRWQDFTDNMQDTPQYVWSEFYKAIAAANHVLDFIASAGNPEEWSAQKGEALLCRAYAHFVLVNLFSRPYNVATASADLGIPYVEEPEKVVVQEYDRGTVQGVYEKIERDLEAGLPLIDDAAYKPGVVKYHFNQKAAYAFAARFNLYYGKYDRTVNYATKALGSSPEKVLRDYQAYKSIASPSDCGIAFVKEKLPCNLLLMPGVSMWNYNHWKSAYSRYAHNMQKLDETLWGPGPWELPERFIPAGKIYGSDQNTYFPKLYGFVEYTDVIAGTGYLNVVSTVFTTDETLLCRAEAYVHQKAYALATADLATWYKARTYAGVYALTEERIASYYQRDNALVCPKLHPGFEVEPGKQESFFRCVLHFRRCETLHEGARWFDIRRFGIEIVHRRYGEPDDVLKKDDLRRVLQLPADVLGAGMQPNPR